jgi:hypothetical protein
LSLVNPGGASAAELFAIREARASQDKVSLAEIGLTGSVNGARKWLTLDSTVVPNSRFEYKGSICSQET